MNCIFYRQIRSLLLIGLLTCFSGGVWGQADQDSLTAHNFLTQSEELRGKREFDASIEKAQSAAALFAELEDWINYQNAHFSICLSGYYARNLDKVIPILEEGLGRIPQSFEAARRKQISTLAFSYQSVGDIFTGVNYYESIIPDLIEAKDSLRLPGILGNVSAGYMQMHEYPKAVKYAEQAVLLSAKLPDKEEHWRNTNFKANAYLWNKNYSLAEKTFQKAQQMKDPKDGTFTRHFTRLSIVQGNFEEALTTLNAKATRTIMDGKPELAYTLNAMKGEALLGLGRDEEAIAVFDQLSEVDPQFTNRRDLGKILVCKAEALLELWFLDRALTTFNEALKVFVPSLETKDSLGQLDVADLIPEAYLINIFSGKGECYLSRFRKAGNNEDLLEAEVNFKQAIDFIDFIKIGFNESASKLLLGEEARQVYEIMLTVKAEQFNRTKDPQYQEDAFLIAQKANAFVLRELLKTKEAMEAANIPEEQIMQWTAQRSSKIRLGRLLEKSPVQLRDSIQQLLLNQELSISNFLKQLEVEHPVFKRLQADIEVASLTDLQSNLEPNSLLIKYFQGDKYLHIFVLSEENYEWHSLALPADFSNIVFKYRKAISDLDFVRDSTEQAEQMYLQTAYQLYHILLARVFENKNHNNVKRLTIVGDGIINNIPFQALLHQPAENWSSLNHFLLSKYAINYAYFCKMLLAKNVPAPKNNDFVSFGLEFDQATLDYLKKISKDSISNQAILENLRSGTLTNLPFSDDEAMELAQLMKGKYWINEKATKSNFLDAAISADFIHMATHSILDEINPNKSALVFIKEKGEQDNLLRQEEIYNLEMEADLIVLSACNTAYGQGHAGEGINSLARAFHVSGIPSVTGTFWNIADEASKKLMGLYYANLKTGMPKDIALQQAQLSYLQNDEVSSPAFRLPPYWAAWINIGNPAPIAKASWPWWYWTLGILLLGFAIFQIRR